MALVRLSNVVQQLQDLLQSLPPSNDDADGVRDACSAATRAAAAELPCDEPLSPADCDLLSRLTVQLSHLLQDFSRRVPAAYQGATLMPPQAVALETQASAAASCATILVQVCATAQLPGSLAYRLASSASLAVFAQGAHGNRWYLQWSRSKPVALRFLENSVSNQCTSLDMLTASLGSVPDGQQLQQLYGRTVAATPAAADWLASAASSMYACTSRQGLERLHPHALFAALCRDVLESDKPCYAGLRQAVQRSPEVQAQLGFALSAGLAARVQAELAEAVAGPDLEAAKHIAAAGHSLRADVVLPLWQAASSGGGSPLQRQAGDQLLGAAQAALQLAAARPCPELGNQSCAVTQKVQSQAHMLLLLLLPHAAGVLGSGIYELAARGWHALLLAAPTAAAALRTTALCCGDQPIFGIGLTVWCMSVIAAVSFTRREQQAATQQPQLQHALAAAMALLRLLPLLDARLQQQRQVESPDTAQLSKAGATAICMLDQVASWAAAWADAVPAAHATPALRRQLWQLLVTVSKVACTAADACADSSAAAADPAAAPPSAEGAAVPAADAAAAAAGEEADAGADAGEAAGGSPLADIVAAGLETISAAAASLQRTADRLWAVCSSADAQSWRDAHVLALLQLQASLVPLLRSPARLPPHEQPVPCGDSFSIANTLLAAATRNEQLFLARPDFADALLPAAEDALLQPLPEGTAEIIDGVLATLCEDASPGMTSDLLDSLTEAVQQSPRLAAALLQHCLGSLVVIAVNLADSRSSAGGEAADAADSGGAAAAGEAAAGADSAGVEAAGEAAGAEIQGTAACEAADPAGSADAAEGAAADSAGSQGTAAAGAAAAPASSVSATQGAADPPGFPALNAAHDAAAAAAVAPHVEWGEMFGFECRLVGLALERSLKEALLAALQRHGAGLQASSSGREAGSGDCGSSSEACGTGSSSSGGASSGQISSTSGGQSSELHTALAAAKQAADSIQLLEDGGEFGRELDFGVLTDVAAQLQRVWQLEQPPEQHRAAGLRLAAAAAHRGCANLRCTNLGGASEGDSRGKKCRGCESVRYCGEACQRADWREGGHRHVCRLLAQQRQQRREEQRQEQEQQFAAGSNDQP